MVETVHSMELVNRRELDITNFNTFIKLQVNEMKIMLVLIYTFHAQHFYFSGYALSTNPKTV